MSENGCGTERIGAGEGPVDRTGRRAAVWRRRLLVLQPCGRVLWVIALRRCTLPRTFSSGHRAFSRGRRRRRQAGRTRGRTGNDQGGVYHQQRGQTAALKVLRVPGRRHAAALSTRVLQLDRAARRRAVQLSGRRPRVGQGHAINIPVRIAASRNRSPPPSVSAAHLLRHRHYATLYFVFCVDESESELGILDLIQVFVETLDRCFENVCELDLVFHMDKVHQVSAGRRHWSQPCPRHV